MKKGVVELTEEQELRVQHEMLTSVLCFIISKMDNELIVNMDEVEAMGPQGLAVEVDTDARLVKLTTMSIPEAEARISEIH